jgi:light-regulated signal transduction histidine kinase (bacteriophytochrome)
LNETVQQLQQLELATLLEETDGTIEIPEPLPEVLADPVQIRQLFQNIIANGIKYHREGTSPRIVITANHIGGDKIKIEVRDNGVGIKQELHEAIFKMFKRVHPRQKYEGAGIGLAVCRKIAERHASQIGVDSKEGEGSAFWFTLPAAREPLLVS